MESRSSAAVAEHLLALSAPDLDGARSALEIRRAAEIILRDRVAELKQELNSKQAAMSPPEESRLVECGPDPLLLVCLFLNTKEKARFLTSSLGLHSTLLGCAIDLTESNEIRKLATIEFVLERFVPFRMFSNRSHEACSCVAARTISGLGVGTCLSLAAQHDDANLKTRLKTQHLHSIGFGRSWSVFGLSLMQESDAEMLPALLTASGPNQISKVAIGIRSTGILTAIGQAVEKGKLTGLKEIEFHHEELDVLEPGHLGTISHFGPAFHRLDLSLSQIVSISGIEKCKDLNTLNLSFTAVTDVSALGSCSSLHTLDLNRTQVADVSALGSCKNLHTLNLIGTQVTDVSALGACSSLHTLDLSCTLVADVSALGSCSKLHTLDLNSTAVTDVSALGSCSSLHTLYLIGTKVTDVSALGSCSSLHTLYLCSTAVADVSALGSCSNLHTLDLQETEVADISALGSCSSLYDLNLSETQVTDVTMLGSCSNLYTLELSNTQVADVSALGSCSNLHTLYLIFTQVTAVSALGSCRSLCKLYLRGTSVVDVPALRPLSGLSILE